LFYFLFGKNVEGEWEPVTRKRRHFNAQYGQFYGDFRGRPSGMHKGLETPPPGTQTPGSPPRDGDESPPRGNLPESVTFAENSLNRGEPRGLERSSSVVVEIEEENGGAGSSQTGERDTAGTVPPDLLTGDAFGVEKQASPEVRGERRVSEGSDEAPSQRPSLLRSRNLERVRMEAAFYIRPFYQVFLLADAVSLAKMVAENVTSKNVASVLVGNAVRC
jgi:hypothetical protein